jgi:glucosyl-dolichyl phosphate glucuronosyltransferase
MLKISVIICTYNRAETIKDLLNCLLIQEFNETFEVIVVDNNSRDNTKEVVKSFEVKFNGKLRYFFQPEQGKTFALNLGIKESKGEIIVFIDDDCLVQKDHLLNIYKTLHENGPDIGVVGGKILPLWGKVAKPAWIIDLKSGWWSNTFFKGPVGIFDCGDKPFIIDHVRRAHRNVTFYGANTSIRKKLLEQYGYFNNERIVGEDTEMCLRLFRAGIKGLYAPGIIVQHKVEAEKITPEYFYHWYYLRGKLLEVHNKYQGKFYHPLGVSWGFWVETAVLWVKSLFAVSLSKKIHYKSHAMFNIGQISQIMKKK